MLSSRDNAKRPKRILLLWQSLLKKLKRSQRSTLTSSLLSRKRSSRRSESLRSRKSLPSTTALQPQISAKKRILTRERASLRCLGSSVRNLRHSSRLQRSRTKPPTQVPLLCKNSQQKRLLSQPLRARMKALKLARPVYRHNVKPCSRRESKLVSKSSTLTIRIRVEHLSIKLVTASMLR